MATQGYRAVDNLEIMDSASNYNGFLISEILKCAGPGSAVLDFGAGTGTFSRQLRDRGLKVTCLEPDENLSRDLLASGFDVCRRLAEYAGEALDLIVCLNVLEHVEDDYQIVVEMRSLLKPAGRVLIYVPAFAILFSSMDRKVGHLRRYTRRRLIKLLRRAGFAIEKAVYVDSLGFGVTLVYQLIGSRRGDLKPGIIRFYDTFAFPVSRLLDKIFGRVVGKNLEIVALPALGVRPDGDL